jgi:hypothetical protein
MAIAVCTGKIHPKNVLFGHGLKKELPMFEHQSHPLLSQEEYIRRVLRYIALSTGIIGVSLAIGILGYHYLEGLPWIDALVNAAMLLGGMGPLTNCIRRQAKSLPRSMLCSRA